MAQDNWPDISEIHCLIYERVLHSLTDTHHSLLMVGSSPSPTWQTLVHPHKHSPAAYWNSGRTVQTAHPSSRPPSPVSAGPAAQRRKDRQLEKPSGWNNGAQSGKVGAQRSWGLCNGQNVWPHILCWKVYPNKVVQAEDPMEGNQGFFIMCGKWTPLSRQ